METKTKATRRCELCGKIIDYIIVEEDGYDYYGHKRGSSRTFNIDYDCNCTIDTHYKRMCLNCKFYKNNICTNEETKNMFLEKIQSGLFNIKVNELVIKEPNRCCCNWDLSKYIAKQLFT